MEKQYHHSVDLEVIMLYKYEGSITQAHDTAYEGIVEYSVATTGMWELQLELGTIPNGVHPKVKEFSHRVVATNTIERDRGNHCPRSSLRGMKLVG